MELPNPFFITMETKHCKACRVCGYASDWVITVRASLLSHTASQGAENKACEVEACSRLREGMGHSLYRYRQPLRYRFQHSLASVTVGQAIVTIQDKGEPGRRTAVREPGSSWCLLR